jgi:hypothetical protein
MSKFTYRASGKSISIIMALLLILELTAYSASAASPNNDLSAEICSKPMSTRQIQLLVSFMVRDDQQPTVLACYWALRGTNKVQMRQAYEQTVGYKDKRHSGPTAPAPRIQSDYWADLAEEQWNTSVPYATAYRYAQDNYCDQDWSDNDWQYEFNLYIQPGDPSRLRLRRISPLPDWIPLFE